MSEAQVILRSACPKCATPIEYPAAMQSLDATCPHCQQIFPLPTAHIKQGRKRIALATGGILAATILLCGWTFFCFYQAHAARKKLREKLAPFTSDVSSRLSAGELKQYRKFLALELQKSRAFVDAHERAAIKSIDDVLNYANLFSSLADISEYCSSLTPGIAAILSDCHLLEDENIYTSENIGIYRRSKARLETEIQAYRNGEISSIDRHVNQGVRIEEDMHIIKSFEAHPYKPDRKHFDPSYCRDQLLRRSIALAEETIPRLAKTPFSTIHLLP